MVKQSTLRGGRGIFNHIGCIASLNTVRCCIILKVTNSLKSEDPLWLNLKSEVLGFTH